MTVYLLRRSAFLVVSLLLAMVAIFVLLRLLPGDPSNALLSASATPEQVAAAQAQVGADQPLAAQFADWFGDLARFDLGRSFISSLPVWPEIASRLVVTVPLTLLAFVLAVAVALSPVSPPPAGRTAGTASCSPASRSSVSPSRCSGSASCW